MLLRVPPREPDPPPLVRLGNRALRVVEDSIYVIIAALLAVAALVVLARAAYGLLEAVREQVPAMAMGEYHAADGEVVNDPTKLAPEAQALLDDYRMVQYDLTIGKRYSEDTMLDLPSQ